MLDFPVYQYLLAQKNQSVSDTNVLKNHKMFATVIFDCISMNEKYKSDISEQKESYIVNTILELIRSQYNIYLRNGFKNNSFDWFISFNEMLKKEHYTYYLATSKKYSYIRALQHENKVAFWLLSKLMKAFKKIKTR